MFKGCHFPKPVILTCMRLYLRCKLSCRDLAEMMAERGVAWGAGEPRNKMVAALGYQTFDAGKHALTGVELVRMIRKGQIPLLATHSSAGQFNALVA